MAIKAVFFNRGVGKAVRATLFGMAGITQFVDGVFGEQRGPHGTVYIVTGRTLHFAFGNGVV